MCACGGGNETDLDTSIPSSENSTTVQENSSVPEESKKEEIKTTDFSSDFKSAMDSYEDFMNDYVEFMKKYQENPNDLSLLTDYATYMSDYAEFVESFEEWENKDLSASELAYYTEVQLRVSKLLLEVTQQAK